ncbi:ABC transporter permease [Candidatus Formimonas warabiya]|uniref:ABC transporter permease n=2 Tax=Formimonas warabiya TaxID=1761012 RepID=A0A3G1L348_FORW1|nr:ABC transporter permease [Candidatus Formimonas warabiya]
MKLVKFILAKFVRMAALLIVLCTISFLLVSHSPIDPVRAYIGADMLRVSHEQQEKIAEYWGLNKPPLERFMRWGQAVLQGNLGTSMIFRRPVTEVIGERFWASIALMGFAWILSGVLGFLMGVVAGMCRGGWLDRAIKWYCLTLASMPAFWLALLLMMIFSVWLGWFPVGLGVPAGVLAENVTLAERIRHLVLPALTLSIVGVANIALHTRQKMIDVLESEYVLFARARGEQGFPLFARHGLRNVALPAITLQFASFNELFGGSVLAEQVFSYPGLGQATVQAGLRGDLPLLLGLVIFSALFVFFGNLAADIIYRVVDPRIREGGDGV